jgi:hypothetical protein
MQWSFSLNYFGVCLSLQSWRWCLRCCSVVVSSKGAHKVEQNLSASSQAVRAWVPSWFLCLMWSGDSLHQLEVWRGQSFASSHLAMKNPTSDTESTQKNTFHPYLILSSLTLFHLKCLAYHFKFFCVNMAKSLNLFVPHWTALYIFLRWSKSLSLSSVLPIFLSTAW